MRLPRLFLFLFPVDGMYPRARVGLESDLGSVRRSLKLARVAIETADRQLELSVRAERGRRWKSG